MRLMSFALTAPQFYRRDKDVTRRLGWEDAEPGELLCGVLRGRVADPIRLAVIRVKSVRRERLRDIHPHDVVREGFPWMDVNGFMRMFCESHSTCRRSTPVTRLEYQFIPGGRFAVVGFCRVCGCSQELGCEPDALGHSCWWVDDRGKAPGMRTTLCSRCFFASKKIGRVDAASVQ